MLVQPVRYRMRDFVTFSLRATENGKKFLHECRDAQSDSGYSLLTWVDATHAGIVNGNMRFYRPDHMQDSCHTWLDPKRAKRPVLVRHDEDCDPLGRVVEAKYIDESYKYVSRYQTVKSLLFYDSTSSKRLDLFKSVDWVLNTLQRRDKDYVGLGHIQLGLNVTNPDAIAKIQRGEFATVSVGFQTDAAICSICHQNWSTDGRCEHRLGEMVDGHRMFIISGRFGYEECSFVNFPADPAAMVTNTEIIARAKDSMAVRVFLLGQAYDEEAGLFRHTDSLPAEAADMLEADIQVVSDEDEETEMELDAIRTEINSKELTRERALALREELAGNADAKRLLTTLKAKITKNGWGGDSAVGLTKEMVEVRIAAAPTEYQAAEDKPAFLAQLEADAATFGLTVPVMDLDPVEVAVDHNEAGVMQPVVDLVKDSKNGDKIVKHVDITRALHDGLEDDSEKSLFRSAMGACMEVLSAEGWLSYMKGRVTQNDELLVNKAEYDTLHDGLEAYEIEKKKIQDASAAMAAANRKLMADYKQAIATQIVMYSVLTGDTGFTGLSADQIRAEIGERSMRQLVSLQDSLKDLTKKLSVQVPEETAPLAEQTQQDGADDAKPAPDHEVASREVLDNAQVQDSTDQPKEPESGSREAQRGEGTVARPVATLEDLRSMRRTAAVDNYLRLKAADTLKTE